MKEMLSILVAVAGGLGAFLLGMKHLSEGLQAVSGPGLRKFMSFATTHRLAGIGTGIASTMIVQSSSIITVMAVGFVSSGFMNLPQAINVIIGSNIGTTTTAWLIAFAPDVRMLGLCVVAVGAALYFVQLKQKLRDFGLALVGLGLIMTKRVPPEVAARSRRLLRLSDELESISDEAVTILKAVRRLRANRQEFSGQSLNVLLAVHERMFSFATEISSHLKSPRPAFDLAEVQEESRSLHELIRAARQGQLGRVSADDPDSPTRVLVELDILNVFERVRACYLNIAETLSGGK